jgi:hypothetical protein
MPRQKIDPEEAALKARGFYDSSVAEMPDSADDEDANVQFADDGTRVEFNEGGITVELEGSEATAAEAGERKEDGFDDNLCDKLTEPERVGLGHQLREYVEIDLEARAQWEQRMVEGLQIIGLEDIPEDAVAFEGAARA